MSLKTPAIAPPPFLGRRVGLGLILITTVLSGGAAGPGWAKGVAPVEGGLPTTVGPPPHGRAMVAAANPLAVEAGLQVLRAGGSAVDAAVAIQAVLGLVEPQSSGLGGGAFMVYFNAKTGRITAYDGRETAPADVTPTLFYGEDGKPLPHFTGVLSGRSTGAPGAIAMLRMAQREHGRKPWASLFTPAERLATEGFVISPRLAGMIAIPQLRDAMPEARTYFTGPDGAMLKAGDRLKNPLYADALKQVARRGPDALLKGPIAAEIVAKVHEGPRPGSLSLSDLAAYRPVKREALCRAYRAWRVCAPPPPAGGVGVLEILGLLESTDIGAGSTSGSTPGPTLKGWTTFAQASRLAYADRDRWVGDPAVVKVPVKGMLDPAYDAARAALIPKLPGGVVAPGTPPGAPTAGADATPEPGGTSSFVVVDTSGNVVSMTTTVESVFGSGRMVHGFFLNNQLTDFSFTPTLPDGAPAANAVGPGKRPRSSMSPAIVLDRRGRFVAATGSPGGASIIAYVTKTLVGLIDWRLTPQQAIDLPNLVAGASQVSLEVGADPAIAEALRATGMTVKTDSGEESGIHVVVRTSHGYVGGADPRREGVAKGW